MDVIYEIVILCGLRGINSLVRVGRRYIELILHKIGVEEVLFSNVQAALMELLSYRANDEGDPRTSL